MALEMSEHAHRNGTEVELSGTNQDGYDSLESVNRDTAAYMTPTPALVRPRSGTNNTNSKDQPCETTVNIVISRTTIGLALIGVFLICTILCALTGLVVYHVIKPHIPEKEIKPSQGQDAGALDALLEEFKLLKKNLSYSSDVARRLDDIEHGLQILQGTQNTTAEGIETDGWEMVFRATAGNGYNVYDGWTTGKDTTDIKPTNMARGTSRHYRSASRVNDWTNVHMVKYSLFKNSREIAYITFNGTKSSNVDWFDKGRVLDSSWSTVASGKGDFNHFSIIGDMQDNPWRKFFVNLLYNTCDGDLGYTVVIDTNTQRKCALDNEYFTPQFLYSKINAADNWSRMLFGRAEYMVIFYKTF